VSERTPTILIVDDEPDLREAIAFDFRRKKFHVLTAASGREAFGIVEKEKIDIVLSDVRMPDGDGVELLDKIKARDAALPVVMFITGFADITLEEAYDKGVDAIFSKPFDRKALMDAVLRAIQPADTRLLRRSSRVDTDLIVGLKFPKSGVDTQTTAKNIGRGGMFVVLEKVYPEIGEKVEFRLESLRTPAVKVDGEGLVRWVRKAASGGYPAGCGIEFLGLEKDSLTQVIDLVNFLKTRAFIPRN